MSSQIPNSNDKANCIDLLSQCRPFIRLSPEVKGLLSGSMHSASFSTGESLMRQGDKGESLMVLSKGTAEVVLESDDQEKRVLKKIARGEVIGEMALLTGEPRTASVIALSNVKAFVLPSKAFESVVREHPAIMTMLTELLSERLANDRHDAFDDKRIKGYRIECCIGRGAMAIVYQAINESSSQRVALKMLDHRLVHSGDALERFQREASIAQALDHENLVKVYDKLSAFRTEFLVMELCGGPTLQQVIEERRRLPENLIKKIIGQLSSGLAYLHAFDSKNLIHRDIKPSNILTDGGTLKVADFGLARPEFDAHLTTTGTVIGTPPYMAPEQFEGIEVNNKVDIYALGCLTYELITGKPLFSFGAPNLASMFSAKIEFKLQPRTEIREDLCSELYEVLQLCLARKPEDRLVQLDEIAHWAAPLDDEFSQLEQKPRYITAMGDTLTLDTEAGDRLLD